MVERVFKDLPEARVTAWNEVCALDDVMTSLKGDLSAVEALSLHLLDHHADDLGPTGVGLQHCAARALEAFKELEEVHERIGEAVLVAWRNDPARLSQAACRPKPDASGDEEAAHG